jgi:hypothetical protein
MTSVEPGYAHRDKICTPRDSVVVSGVPLKWYDVGAADEYVPDPIRARAVSYLEREQPTFGGDLGFVILHRCGDGEFYFLLVQTWMANNEIWKTTFSKDKAAADFALFPLNEPHKGTFCVWEAGVVAREVAAWKRYLRSPRDGAAKRDYLADVFTGVV